MESTKLKYSGVCVGGPFDKQTVASAESKLKVNNAPLLENGERDMSKVTSKRYCWTNVHGCQFWRWEDVKLGEALNGMLTAYEAWAGPDDGK